MIHEPPQEAKARALGFKRGIRLVAEVGVLSVGRDLVVDNGPRPSEPSASSTLFRIHGSTPAEVLFVKITHSMHRPGESPVA